MEKLIKNSKQKIIKSFLRKLHRVRGGQFFQKAGGKKVFFLLVLILLTFITGWSQSPVKTEEVTRYSYTLAPAKMENNHEYTRREIESFLCACAPGYIRVEDVHKIPATGEHFIKALKMNENQKKMAENQEISKWFEDRVTVTSKGKLTVLDIEATARFFKKVNQVIGKEKFFYTPGLETANIVIELTPLGKTSQFHDYAGETSVLEDNLRVRITTSDENPKPHIETYTPDVVKIISESGDFNFTPLELEFSKKNRIVKVVMKNILDPHTRYFAFIHELLHSIGFPGHSPYLDSHIFPLPVEAYKESLPVIGINDPVFTDLAAGMVEMLYRPEILPGMTIKEASEVLARLKRIDKTQKNQIISFLMARKTRLTNQKKSILQKEGKKYNDRMKNYIELDQLVMKEQWYLEELEEIRTDYGLDTKVVEEIRAATSKVGKLVRIRQELILAESQKKRLEKGGKARRELKRLEEEIVVLNNLLKIEGKISASEQEIMAAISSFSQKQLLDELRRILRQLYTIDKELESLSDNTPL